jgi:hypothetical protein
MRKLCFGMICEHKHNKHFTHVRSHKDNESKAKPHRIMHYSTYTLPKKAQSFTSPKIKVKK